MSHVGGGCPFAELSAVNVGRVQARDQIDRLTRLPCSSPVTPRTGFRDTSLVLAISWVSSRRIGKPVSVRKLQYRCAGLSTRQLTACRRIQARKAATGIVVIHAPAVLDRAGAINDLPGLIEFERQLR